MLNLDELIQRLNEIKNRSDSTDVYIKDEDDDYQELYGIKKVFVDQNGDVIILT